MLQIHCPKISLGTKMNSSYMMSFFIIPNQSLDTQYFMKHDEKVHSIG
jgi:hypothetical protein